MTLRQAALALRERRLSSVELTGAAIERTSRLNPVLNAFLTVLPERALERAAVADRELASGTDRGPLQGIPVALKDLFDMRGVRTTAGSRIYNYIANRDSAVVEKLEQAGAVILGKLNMHELAYGITSDNPHYGAVHNPWSLERIPGGSSGGSGAAVAAEMVFAAMGSDTGGSIRVPAALCGTVGLKPTYGRVSRFGALPLAFSLDHMGPLARNVRDAAIVLNAIAGHDPRDPGAARHPVADYLPGEGCSIPGVRIGLPEAFFGGLEPDVNTAVRSAITTAESLGAVLIPIQMPDIAALNAVGQVILLAEAAAVMEPHLERRESIGADVLDLLDQGRLLPASDYINAQRLRRGMQLEVQSIWRAVDCLVTPALPRGAPRIGEMRVRLAGEDVSVRAAATRFLRPFNVLGLPSISIPCGLTAMSLPIGLQIVGPPFEERRILRVAAALEDAGVTIPPCPL